MGTYGSKQTRKELIRELETEPLAPGWSVLYTAETPSGLWRMLQSPAGDRLIAFDLITVEGAWSYHKPMDETVGPFYHDVPLWWLSHATSHEADGYSADWRQRVRKYHADRAAKARDYSPERLAEIERESHSDADPGL